MLTNEELEKIVKRDPCFNGIEIGKMARELLALRSLRDAGDEEVERLTNEILYQLRTSDIAKLRDTAIARGQQLREAREEIERLDQVVRELKDNFGEMEVGA